MKQFIIIIVLSSILSCNSKTNFKDFKEADIIFQISNSRQSEAIQIATNSKYSHVGIITLQDGKYFVLETLNTVKFTPLNDWIERGENAHYVVKRLRADLNSDLKERNSNFKIAYKKYIGKLYDKYFEWSDSKMYCSELVWKLYNEVYQISIGQLKTIKNFELTNPVVKKILTERYGSSIPYNETVISPADIFNSKLLYTVYSN
jgi:uncharacterized protein YycO